MKIYTKSSNTHDRKSILSLQPLLKSTGVLKDAYEDLQCLSLKGIFYTAKEQSTVDMDLGTDPTIRT